MAEFMTSSNVVAGAYGGKLSNAGVPSNGTSEVQTLTIGGTPTATASSAIGFQTTAGKIGGTTALWSATNATLLANVQAALDALLGTNECVASLGTITAGVGTILLTYSNNSAALNVPALTAINNLTGSSPTAVITTTTAGVTATHRGAGKGQLCVDTTNNEVYENQGTTVAPDWNKITTS